MVLEEVQMPLGELLEIMRLAKVAAIRAGKLRTTLRLEHNIQDMGLFVRIETLFHQSPWWRNPETKSQYILSIHCLSLRCRK
jgi:hypothetical protein